MVYNCVTLTYESHVTSGLDFMCMQFLGPAIRNVRLHAKYFTPGRYRNFVQHVNLSPIMVDSPKSSIPQIRVLLGSEADEPAHKKLRLDDHDHEDIDRAMEEPMASTSQSTTNNSSEKKSKKKNKKRREPPLPELCSATDVLYQEIRLMLGEDVVDRVTSEGGAFKSPYSRGDEIEVNIDRMSAGGKC